MNFEEVLDSIRARLTPLWEKIQETDTWANLREKFLNLPSKQQLAIAVGSIVLAILLLLSIPLSRLFSSSEILAEFEERRSLIRNLIRAGREAGQLPAVQAPPGLEALKAQADSVLSGTLSSAQYTINNGSASRLLTPDLVSSTLEIQLKQINLRQVVDLGHQLSVLHPSVKMEDFSMTASREAPGFFDVVVRLVALNVPEFSSAGEDGKERGGER
ncbi:MAG: hypothetical protein N2578_02255 [Bdellovibrionaceae bacterium]|nr:hypothetical protein [Pseudobdellovibrionaceae bacterium]